MGHMPHLCSNKERLHTLCKVPRESIFIDTSAKFKIGSSQNRDTQLIACLLSSPVRKIAEPCSLSAAYNLAHFSLLWPDAANFLVHMHTVW